MLFLLQNRFFTPMQTLTFSQRKLNSINTASKTILAGGRCLNGAGFGWFLLSRQPLQNRVPGNACERLRWRIQRAGVGAAVEKIEESGSPKIFSGTARGVAKQFRALLPLPRKRHLRKQVPFSVKSTLRVEEIPFGDDPPVGIKSLRRWVDLISSAKRISSTTQISSLREQGFHYKEIAGLFQLNPPIFDGF